MLHYSVRSRKCNQFHNTYYQNQTGFLRENNLLAAKRRENGEKYRVGLSEGMRAKEKIRNEKEDL